MSQDRVFIVTSDDAESRRLAKAMARENLVVLTAGLAAGLSVEQASAMCTPLSKAPSIVRQLTNLDRERMDAAERKRQRRAAKRCAEVA